MFDFQVRKLFFLEYFYCPLEGKDYFFGSICFIISIKNKNITNLIQ